MAIQLFVPTFRTEECLAEIKECLDKGWTGLGFKTVEIEAKWKEYTGLPYAHFLGSATVGLDMAVRILKMENGWKDGDEIITTPLTFVSTNHAILYNNMKAVFADVDEYLCLDPKSVEERITKKTRAVIFVGLGGNSGKYEKVKEICKKHNLKLILDAAHMSGTRVNGKHVGHDCDVAVFSYQAVKNMPTADSGMICFKEQKYDEIARKLSWLGINKDTYARSVSSKGAYKWKYDVEYLGYKNHGNSIMAAIGLVSLKYLDRDNAYRRQLAKWYEEDLKDCKNVTVIKTAPNCESSRHLFQILVNDRDKVMLALNEAEIYPGVHYRDNTEYKMYSYAKGTCPKAHEASEKLLSLPMHMRLTRNDVKFICEKIKEYMEM